MDVDWPCGVSWGAAGPRLLFLWRIVHRTLPAMTRLPWVQHTDGRAPTSLLTHQQTGKTRGCRPFCAAGRPGQPRPCPGAPLVRGRPWRRGASSSLPPTPDRGPRWLDLTRGAPLLTHLLWPERQPAEHWVPSPRPGSSVSVARGSKALPLAPPSCAAPCCTLLLGFRVQAPSPKHTHSPPTPRRLVPSLGPSCLVPEASALLCFT